MKLRRFEPADQAGLIQLWRDVFPHDPAHNEPAAVLAAKLAVDDLIFVAEDDSSIVGACMAGYDGHRGWLYAVAVSSNYRRQSIGRKLVEQAIEGLKEIGCIKVNLQIRSTNTAVAEFYRSLGFATEDRMSMGLLLK